MAMSRFADLIVAVDGSPPSDRAVSFALALAARAGATLGFCSVVGERGELTARLACVHAVARAVAHAIETCACIAVGSAAEAIVAHALATGAHGIVVGTRARTGERAVLGRVAAALVRLSPVPVFTVCADTAVRDGCSIVVAIDDTPAAEAALAASLELALERNATLHLVHVVQERTALADEQRAFAAIVDRVRAAGVAYSAELREGDPVAELVDAAERRAAALIATGTHGHNAIARLVLGSVAEGLVRAASVPVMTVRA